MRTIIVKETRFRRRTRTRSTCPSVWTFGGRSTGTAGTFHGIAHRPYWTIRSHRAAIGTGSIKTDTPNIAFRIRCTGIGFRTPSRIHITRASRRTTYVDTAVDAHPILTESWTRTVCISCTHAGRIFAERCDLITHTCCTTRYSTVGNALSTRKHTAIEIVI